jgi:Uma2 family endonuclease
LSAQLTRHAFTVADFYRMGEAGILSEDDRVELIEGELLEMSPIGSRHAACVDRLINLLAGVTQGRVIVRAQNPVRLGDRSEPQPDLVLLKPRADFYARNHPTQADVILLVEVADSSTMFDREIKLPLYGKSGVPETWLVLLEKEVIEVHRCPSIYGYTNITLHHPGGTIAVPGFEGLELSVNAMLGLEGEPA